MTHIVLPPPPRAPRNAEHPQRIGLIDRLAARGDHLSSMVVAGIIVAAIVGDVAAFAGPASVAGFASIAATALVLLASGVGQTRRGAALLISACAVGLWLPVRASAALHALDLVVSASLLVAAALLHRVARLRPAIAVFAGLIARSRAVVAGPIALLGAVVGSIPRGAPSPKAAPIVRGLLVAVIPVVVLGALLASADAVFASFFAIDPGVDVDNLVGHTIVAGVLACGLAGLLCVAESRRVDDVPIYQPLGAIESIVVLGAVAVLFAGFATTQVVVALGGADHVLETEGLTRATYAREGFFQLLAVAAFTLLLVVGVQTFGRLDSERERLAYRSVSTLVSLLTLVIVGVSIQRLNLYADAFGLTMLRLCSTGFAVLIGVIFVLFAAASISGTPRHWFWNGSGLAAVTALIALNALNPEAFIARWNIELAAQNGAAAVALDQSYLESLSADAVPVLVEMLPERSADWCGKPGRFTTTYGFAGQNLAYERASKVCQ